MKYLLLAITICFAVTASAQDETVLLKQADTYEKQFKENDALDTYKFILLKDSTNLPVLIKCAELSCSIGERQPDKIAKANYFQSAKTYADRALTIDPNNANANYAEALCCDKLTETETENRKTADDVKQTYSFALKALSIDPNHAKANYIAGKWHYDMLTQSLAKKLIIKTMVGGLPKPDIDSAISYMEKCRSLDVYFTPCYLDLAKAYHYKNRPAQEIEVLTKMVRLPNRTADDAALKAEGQQMLSALQ